MGMAQSGPFQVFLSHAHADNELCDQYVEALRVHGMDVWYDRTNLQGGRSLSDEIQRELQARKVFIVILTPASVESYWVKTEIDAYRSLSAADRTRLLLPVRAGECDIPLLLRGLLYIDAASLPMDSAIEQIVRAMTDPAGSASSASPVPGYAEQTLPRPRASSAPHTSPVGGRPVSETPPRRWQVVAGIASGVLVVAAISVLLLTHGVGGPGGPSGLGTQTTTGQTQVGGTTPSPTAITPSPTGVTQAPSTATPDATSTALVTRQYVAQSPGITCPNRAALPFWQLEFAQGVTCTTNTEQVMITRLIGQPIQGSGTNQTDNQLTYQPQAFPPKCQISVQMSGITSNTYGGLSVKTQSYIYTFDFEPQGYWQLFRVVTGSSQGGAIAGGSYDPSTTTTMAIAIQGTNVIFQVNDQTVKTYTELSSPPVVSAEIEVSASGIPAQADFANFVIMPLS